jgi:hypothetical protein
MGFLTHFLVGELGIKTSKEGIYVTEAFVVSILGLLVQLGFSFKIL